MFIYSKDEDIKRFRKTFGITFPVGRETPGLTRALGVTGMPETVFVDRYGGVARRHKGTITYEQLVSGIEEILK